MGDNNSLASLLDGIFGNRGMQPGRDPLGLKTLCIPTGCWVGCEVHVAAGGQQSRIVLVRTTDPQARRTRKAIEKYPHHFAPVALRYLVAYPDSYAAGEGVLETYPDSVAAAEVRALFDYVLEIVGGGRNG